MTSVDRLLSQHPTTTLYHYTSAAGLIGIVEGKSLWASGIHYLNDTSEYSYAGSMMRDCAVRALKANPEHPWREYYLELLDYSEVMFSDTMVFVASLSEAGDKLSQWRAYGPPGGGFCIGFAPDRIHQLACRQDYELVKCEYNPQEQTTICDEFITAGCQNAEEQKPVKTKTGPPQRTHFGLSYGLWEDCVKPLMRFAPALKNPSFVEEQEWRLIRGPFDGPDETLRFRPGKYGAIPYRQFALVNPLLEGSGSSKLEIEELIVGPNPDPKQAMNAVDWLFMARGVKCKKISNYSGTLRNW